MNSLQLYCLVLFFCIVLILFLLLAWSREQTYSFSHTIFTHHFHALHTGEGVLVFDSLEELGDQTFIDLMYQQNDVLWSWSNSLHQNLRTPETKYSRKNTRIDWHSKHSRLAFQTGIPKAVSGNMKSCSSRQVLLIQVVCNTGLTAT